MIEINKYRSELDGELLSHGIKSEDILLFAQSDLGSDQEPRDTYLMLTAEKLIVTEGVTAVSGKPGKNVIKTFCMSSYSEYEKAPSKIFQSRSSYLPRYLPRSTKASRRC